MTLTLVIPALNEESAIAGTISRCLAATPRILAAGVDAVQIVVVSDGSTDGTVDAASRFLDQGVELIVFERNRGYGAAIQAGWEKGGGELLGFLDADGTCDPAYFADLCRAVLDGADIAVGNRMGKDSKMPAIRRLGNTLFAIIMGGLAGKKVNDTASGMRVVRRDCLPKLQPLPSGLHFTPAMTAQGLMQGLRICEVPMTYHERIGRSKLSVLKDGVRFLRSILGAALFLRPSRITGPILLVLLALVAAMSLRPICNYVQYHRIEDWMIYRTFLILLFLNLAGLIWSATVVSERVIALTCLRYASFMQKEEGNWNSGGRVFRKVLTGSSLLPLVALVLVWPGLSHYARTGTIPFDVLHWPRVVIAFELIILPAQLWITALLLRTVSTLHVRQPFLLEKHR